jgi:type VI secretion system protein ImpK
MTPSSTLSTPLLPLAFRNTAATVSALADGAAPLSYNAFRKICEAQVGALQRELTSAGHLPDVVRDALYAQCALLDEAALTRLSGIDREAWEREPLQIREFNTNDAGEHLISVIERRLAEPQPKLVLLMLLNAVLGLGFHGKFALNGTEARAKLMRAVDERLGQVIDRDISGPVLLAGGSARRALRAFSPVSLTVIGCIVAGMVYLAIERWFAASIARLVS